ncbi:MAG: hypothetical protein ACRDPE_07520 [Solirubrobacterales bacterium]
MAGEQGDTVAIDRDQPGIVDPEAGGDPLGDLFRGRVDHHRLPSGKILEKLGDGVGWGVPGTEATISRIVIELKFCQTLD